MSKTEQAWNLFIRWVSRKMRSPFSNYATKFVLFLGSGVIAAPIFEHLIFSAILKHGFGIDLGVDVPDTKAYVTGSLLVAFSLVHNLIFIKMNQDYQIRVKDTEVSVYKDLWGKLDTVIDDTARLTNLYITYYSEDDHRLALKAEEAVIECSDFLRKNRPFFFSEDFYKKCTSIINDSYREIKAFRACLNAKIEQEREIGKDALERDQLDYQKNNYNYYLGQEEAFKILSKIQADYDEICEEIREHIALI